MNATPSAKTVRLRQGSDAWMAFRQTHIGSSDAPVIAGESPFRSPLALYLEKTEGPEVADPGTERLFRIGHAMEPVILGLYADETGRKVAKGRVLESRDLPWLSCSLDGEAEGRIVEAKWTSSSRWDGGVPGDVMVQVTHQMGVSGIPVADVAVLTPRDFTVYEVPFDRSFWDGILALEQTFRERIRLHLPPPPDASESSRKALLRLHPADTGEILDADPVASEIIRDLLEAKKVAKNLEGTIGSLENSLRYMIGDASGMKGTGFSVSYKKASDTERVDWKNYAGSLEEIIRRAWDDSTGEIGSAPDLDTLRGVYTTTQTGSRRLLVKEA
jgi:putative phage-type endonuclease